MEINVLYEDAYIIVVEKPAGVPSQPDLSGVKALTEHVADYLGQEKVALVQRLDRPVGGVMVLGKSEFSGRKLARSVAERQFEKQYLAVVCGNALNSAELRDNLLKNERQNISKVVPKTIHGAKEAILCYECLDRKAEKESEALSLVKIKLLTGRHHQIRVQLAHAGLPIWGDKKYNPLFMKSPLFRKLALWAGQLTFEHPKTGERLTFHAEPWNETPFDFFL